jgi:hypothetical protein
MKLKVLARAGVRKAANKCAISWAAALVALLVSSGMQAQEDSGQAAALTILPPAGVFEYELGDNGSPVLWNFTGTCHLPFYNTLRFRHDARGLINAFFETGDTNSAVLIGRIKGTAADLKLRLWTTNKWPEVYSDEGSWYQLGALREDAMTLVFEADPGRFAGLDRVRRTEGTWRLASDYQHMEYVTSVRKFIKPVAFSAPDTADGRWLLQLDITAQGSKLSGSGWITCTSGQVFQMQLLGSYSARTQKSKIVLRGTEDSEGARLVLSLVGLQQSIKSLRGTVGGQKLHYP